MECHAVATSAKSWILKTWTSPLLHGSMYATGCFRAASTCHRERRLSIPKRQNVV